MPLLGKAFRLKAAATADFYASYGCGFELKDGGHCSLYFDVIWTVKNVCFIKPILIKNLATTRTRSCIQAYSSAYVSLCAPLLSDKFCLWRDLSFLRTTVNGASITPTDSSRLAS